MRELPYTFRTRVAGESKLDAGVLFDFGLLLLDKLIGRLRPGPVRDVRDRSARSGWSRT